MRTPKNINSADFLVDDTNIDETADQ